MGTRRLELPYSSVKPLTMCSTRGGGHSGRRGDIKRLPRGLFKVTDGGKKMEHKLFFGLFVWGLWHLGCVLMVFVLMSWGVRWCCVCAGSDAHADCRTHAFGCLLQGHNLFVIA